MKKVHFTLRLNAKGKIASVYEKSPTWPNGKEWAGSEKSVEEYTNYAKWFYATVIGWEFTYNIA